MSARRSRGSGPGAARVAVAAALGSAIAGAAYRRGALNGSGAAAAAAIGGVTYLAGGVRWSCLLLAFFGSSSALSRLESRGPSGPAIASMTARGSRRDAVQALANGGASSVAALLQVRRRDPLFAAAFAGALAAANADTWATEWGAMSTRKPVDILSGKAVDPGTSGGVTLPGLLGSLGGSVLVGGLSAALQRGQAPLERGAVVALSGICGSLADSAAGSALQAVYRCPACGELTERRVHRCGTPTVLMRGLPWCTNDVVNVLGTAAGALVCALVTGLAGYETE